LTNRKAIIHSSTVPQLAIDNDSERTENHDQSIAIRRIDLMPLIVPENSIRVGIWSTTEEGLLVIIAG